MLDSHIGENRGLVAYSCATLSGFGRVSSTELACWQAIPAERQFPQGWDLSQRI